MPHRRKQPRTQDLPTSGEDRSLQAQTELIDEPGLLMPRSRAARRFRVRIRMWSSRSAARIKFAESNAPVPFSGEDRERLGAALLSAESRIGTADG
jgi:hypothetical protein